jgi:DNA-binding CsgD family transcriptional regulator
MTVAEIPRALTPRENEVAALVSSGLANKEIARMLGLTEGSVKQYLHTAFRKLGIRRREHLILHARRLRQS